MMSPLPRLLYVVTHSMTARHLLNGQLSFMRRAGFEVAVACSPGPDLDAVAEREGVQVFRVEIPREIDPVADLRAGLALVRLMRRWRPDVVNAGTPKAGVLGMLAARVVGVPVRLYVLRGLRLETITGIKRILLSATEWMASACAHQVVSVSHSLAERYVGMKLARSDKVQVLGSGTSNGVRAERFAAPHAEAISALRARLELPAGVPVVGFVGRFTRDKGICELVEAFEIVRRAVPEARLLLVGDFETGDPVPETLVRRIEESSFIVRAGFLTDTAPAYALMTVLAFPSHREGFPNVPLEAAAAGLPVAGFRATGTVDAVVDGETGSLVDIGDIAGLADVLRRYLVDRSLRERHGLAGQARVRTRFRPEHIWEALLREYDRHLEAAGKRRGSV